MRVCFSARCVLLDVPSSGVKQGLKVARDGCNFLPQLLQCRIVSPPYSLRPVRFPHVRYTSSWITKPLPFIFREYLEVFVHLKCRASKTFLI